MGFKVCTVAISYGSPSHYMYDILYYTLNLIVEWQYFDWSEVSFHQLYMIANSLPQDGLFDSLFVYANEQ